MNDKTEPNNQTELSVILSRDEVLAILNLLDVSTIPGLGEEPIPNLSDEQQALSLIVAERALRARGLAAINEEGRLLVQSGILEMLGACAYASQSLHITQIAAPSGRAAQFVVHQRGEAWVLHTRPEPVLHAFQRLDSWPKTMAQLADLCQWPSGPADAGYRLATTAKTLSAVRELAANGDIDGANALLETEGNDQEAGQRLTSLLAAPHFVTVVQRVRIESSDAMSIQSVTVLHRDQTLLVAVEPAETADSGDGKVVIQPASLDALEQTLADLVTS